MINIATIGHKLNLISTNYFNMSPDFKQDIVIVGIIIKIRYNQ